jgi:hypothetical protein
MEAQFTYRCKVLRPGFRILMLGERAVLLHIALNFLDYLLKKRQGDASTIDFECWNVLKLSNEIETNVRGDVIVLDFRKADIQTLL